MPVHIDLHASAPWRELRSTPETGLPPIRATSNRCCVSGHLIRAFEEKVLDLAGAGARAWPRAFGDRPGGRRHRLGAAAALQRPGQRLAPRAPPVPRQVDPPRRAGTGFAATSRSTPTCGSCRGARWPRSSALAQGYLQGRGAARCTCAGSEAGALGTNAIVGGGVPMAAGCAWAHTPRRHGRRRRPLFRRRRRSTSARCWRR